MLGSNCNIIIETITTILAFHSVMSGWSFPIKKKLIKSRIHANDMNMVCAFQKSLIYLIMAIPFLISPSKILETNSTVDPAANKDKL